MSEESRPSRLSLEGLGGLTRSGSAGTAGLEGHAKDDDSGLIDLRAMSEAPPPVAEKPADAHAAAADAKPEAAKVAAADLAKTAPARPAAMPVAQSVASTEGANAAAAKPEKKGAGIWLALGGLAAAAAVAFVALPMMRKDDAPASAAKQAAAEPEKKADDKVAQADKAPQADKAAPSAAPAPTASAEAAATVATADPSAAAAPAKVAAPAGGPVAPGAKAAAPADPAAKPGTKTTAAAAPTADPINKPAGGSLDDVLGIGKDNPAAAKKPEADSSLPDKPDSIDVRSAINAKVSAASACVKGLDGPSSVSVSFAPGGNVSGVNVTSGPAKGTGAEACIKNAFSKCKVPASKKGASGSATLVP